MPTVQSEILPPGRSSVASWRGWARIYEPIAGQQAIQVGEKLFITGGYTGKIRKSYH